MREIKFRAWDVQRMWPLAYAGDVNPAVWDDQEKYWKECTDGAVVMQYTGLKDKNSVEIYEGDIMEFHGITRTKYLPIAWSREHGCWMVGAATFLECPPEKLEVSGNIYDNPELLTNPEEPQK